MTSNISFLIAFFAGFLSFISPCVLPLIPSYLTYITGISFDELSGAKTNRIRRLTIYHSLFFILGFSLVFIALGASATLIGSFLSNYLGVVKKIGGILIILLGIYVSGLLGKFGFLEQEKRFDLRRKPLGYIGSSLVGIVFAAGWTPCVGPILASILVYASTSETMSTGIFLLAAYSFGLGVPFFLSSLAFSSFLSLFSRVRKHLRWVSLISGIFLIIVGVLIFFDLLQIIVSFLPG